MMGLKRNNRLILILSLIIPIVVFGIYFSYLALIQNDNKEVQAVKSNTQIGDFTVRDLGDREYVKGSSDEIRIYEVFASWCIPCRDSVPVVLDWAQDNPKVEVVGLVFRDVDFEVDRFMDEYGKFETVLAPNGSIEKAFGVSSVPQTIFAIDGRIKYRLLGSISYSDLDKTLRLVERELSSSN